MDQPFEKYCPDKTKEKNIHLNQITVNYKRPKLCNLILHSLAQIRFRSSKMFYGPSLLKDTIGE